MSDNLDKKLEDAQVKLAEAQAEVDRLSAKKREARGVKAVWGIPNLPYAIRAVISTMTRITDRLELLVDRGRFVATEERLASMVKAEQLDPFDPPEQFYRKDIPEFRRRQNEEYIKALHWEREYQFGPRAFEEDIKLTWRLLRKARKLRVTVPEMYHETNEGTKVTDDWYETDQSLTTVLRDKGVRKLREAIRVEQHRRWSVVVPVITAITGLVGVLVGLVSVLR